MAKPDVLEALQRAINQASWEISAITVESANHAIDKLSELIAADVALDLIDAMLPCDTNEMPDPVAYLKSREVAVARRAAALAACRGL